MKNFTRDDRPFRPQGVRGEAISLSRYLRGQSQAGTLLAADLSLGVWRHFQAAADIFCQLGLGDPLTGLERNLSAVRSADLPPPSAVGARIDLETGGERTAEDAFLLSAEAARRIAARRQPTTLCILAGCRGLAWEEAEVLFLRFLATRLRSTPHRLLLAFQGSGEPDLPQDWIVEWSTVPQAAPEPPGPGEAPEASFLSLVPGIVGSDASDLLKGGRGLRERLIALPGGCFMIPPHWRRAVGPATTDLFDQLARQAAGIPRLAAYASFCGSGDGQGAAILWEFGRAAFDAGGLGIASRFLERAVERARTAAERSVFEILAQGARIRRGRFQEAADGMEVDPHLPAELAGWLWFTRGWARTMLGRPKDAEPCLLRARQLLAPEKATDDYLYVLNISALNRLRLGDWDGAFALESKIRSQLSAVSAGHWQIAYINSLNLARLSWRRKRRQAACDYYREAFETSRGVWSDSDLIYRCVCLAKLCEADQDHVGALRFWTRAALYWISSPIPEAIAVRVTNAIVESGGSGQGKILDRVCRAFAERLSTLVESAEGETRPERQWEGSEMPAFPRCEDLEGAFIRTRTWHAVRAQGVWLLASRSRRDSVQDSASARRLRGLLASLLLPKKKSGLPFAGTVLVDVRFGSGLPESGSDLLAAALRLMPRCLVSQESALRVTRGRLAELERLLRARLSPAVSMVHPRKSAIDVAFKRYKPARRFVGPQARLLTRVAKGRQIEIGPLPASTGGKPTLFWLRQLERERAIELFLPEELSFSFFADEEVP